MANVQIDIKGMQNYDNGETDTTGLNVQGDLTSNNGVYEISYIENENGTANAVKTVISLEDNKKAVIKRTGAVNSCLVIEKGVQHNCTYATPHGDFIIGIQGDTILSVIDGSEGKIHLGYTMYSNNVVVSKNITEIHIKEIEE